MAKVTIADVGSGYLSTTAINDAFNSIEAELNNKVLYRVNPAGEPNQMENSLDMNSNRILNLPVPLASTEAARLADVQNAVAGGAANLIAFTPYLNLASTNVQAAIQEEIDDLASPDPGKGAALLSFAQSIPSLLINDTSLNYGGASSRVHIKNNSGEQTLTLRHDETNALATPRDSLRIFRVVDSLGGGSFQTGGLILRGTVQANVNHHEFGVFSILDVNATASTMEHVGMYSQITSLGAAASPVWGAVFEARNTTPTGGGTSVDHVIAGIEVDVVNAKAFSDTLKKIGVECIAFGGGENTEAFSIYAASNTRGNGSYNSGHWRYGLRMLGNSLHETLGVGVNIASSHGTGIQITGASANYAIHLNADAASLAAINIESTQYTVPIALPADKTIRMNGLGSTRGIQYASSLTAVVMEAPAIGVTGHTTYTSATAGTNGAVPAQVTGYIGFYVNGVLQKIPYFNA